MNGRTENRMRQDEGDHVGDDVVGNVVGALRDRILVIADNGFA